MTELTNLAARKEMVSIARRMNASGINQGTAGNLSLRVPEDFLITPTSLPYDRTEAEDIVEMAFDGTHSGEHRPSSEWRFHRDILKAPPGHQRRPPLPLDLRHDARLPVQDDSRLPLHGRRRRRHRPSASPNYATFGTQQLSDNAIEALDGTGSPASSGSTA